MNTVICPRIGPTSSLYIPIQSHNEDLLDTAVHAVEIVKLPDFQSYQQKFSFSQDVRKVLLH